MFAALGCVYPTQMECPDSSSSFLGGLAPFSSLGRALDPFDRTKGWANRVRRESGGRLRLAIGARIEGPAGPFLNLGSPQGPDSTLEVSLEEGATYRLEPAGRWHEPEPPAGATLLWLKFPQVASTLSLG